MLGLDLLSLEYAGASFFYNKQHDDSLCVLFPIINLGHILVVFSRIHIGCPCLSMNFAIMSFLSDSPEHIAQYLFLDCTQSLVLTIVFFSVMSNVYGMSRAVKYDMRSLSHRKLT